MPDALIPTIAQVVDAIAQHLHNEGAATFAVDSVYPPTVTAPAVYLGQLYSTPDPAVAIAHYYQDADTIVTRGNPYMRVQLRWRGDRDPRTVHRLAEAGHDALQSLTPRSWPGGVRIVRCVRQIVAPIEPDENGRWERADSYEIQLNPNQIGASNG